MKNIKKYIGMEVNGFKWFSHYKGVHSFQKRCENGYVMVECTEEQLYNGDIDFMTKNGWTLGKQKRKEIHNITEKSG